MILPQRQYRDPLESLISEEEKTCKGCQHLDRHQAWQKDYCTNVLVKSPLATKRCQHYEEQ